MVCATLLRPGKLQYVVKSDSSGYCSPTSTVICQPRADAPLPNLSDYYLHERRRDFHKDESIFAEFKDESLEAKDKRNGAQQSMVVKQMLEHDLKSWRVSRVVKIDFDVSISLTHPNHFLSIVQKCRLDCHKELLAIISAVSLACSHG